jgi:hypothetical protein
MGIIKGPITIGKKSKPADIAKLKGLVAEGLGIKEISRKERDEIRAKAKGIKKVAKKAAKKESVVKKVVKKVKKKISKK